MAASSYIDHYRPPVEEEMGSQIEVSWTEFTAKRLAFLYPGEDRSAAQALYVALWNALGRRSAA